MLSIKFSKWLRKQAGTKADKAFGKEIGLAQSNVNRQLKKKAVELGYDARLDKFEEIARKLRPNKKLSEILAEVELEGSRDPRTPSERNADAAYRVWLSMFSADPVRGEQVVANLEVQRRLDLIDLVSRVVHVIVTQHDQTKRMQDVMNLLAEEEKSKRNARFVKIAEAYAEAYERLGEPEDSDTA